MAADGRSLRRGRTARDRLLRLLPTAIAALWIAGIAEFRAFGFGPIDYGTLLLAAIALQMVTDRLRGHRPPIALPERSNPATVALLAAGLSGGLALALGGVAEALIPPPADVAPTPWALRTVWHGACAFAASYCRFLERLTPTR